MSDIAKGRRPRCSASNIEVIRRTAKKKDTRGMKNVGGVELGEELSVRDHMKRRELGERYLGLVGSSLR